MSRSLSSYRGTRKPGPDTAGRSFCRQLGAVGLGVFLGLSLVGCDEPTLELRSAVELLAAEHGEVAERAWERVEHHGRAALPYLEAALHRVTPSGRRNIVLALRRLALPESASLIGHVAAFDSDPEVRAAAYHTLESWASQYAQGRPALGAAARSALQQVDAVRSAP